MPFREPLKSRIMDQKDRDILMLLQKDGRETLTNIAKKVNLSIDSVNNRLKALQSKGVFSTGIFVDPRVIGFDFIVDVRMKMCNFSPEEKEKFITYLVSHPRVINLLSITGHYDFLATLISKNANEFEIISTEIRNRFKNAIVEWDTTLILKTHKLETYDLTA